MTHFRFGISVCDWYVPDASSSVGSLQKSVLPTVIRKRLVCAYLQSVSCLVLLHAAKGIMDKQSAKMWCELPRFVS